MISGCLKALRGSSSCPATAYLHLSCSGGWCTSSGRWTGRLTPAVGSPAGRCCVRGPVRGADLPRRPLEAACAALLAPFRHGVAVVAFLPAGSPHVLRQTAGFSPPVAGRRSPLPPGCAGADSPGARAAPPAALSRRPCGAVLLVRSPRVRGRLPVFFRPVAGRCSPLPAGLCVPWPGCGRDRCVRLLPVLPPLVCGGPLLRPAADGAGRPVRLVCPCSARPPGRVPAGVAACAVVPAEVAVRAAVLAGADGPRPPAPGVRLLGRRGRGRGGQRRGGRVVRGRVVFRGGVSAAASVLRLFGVRVRVVRPVGPTLATSIEFR